MRSRVVRRVLRACTVLLVCLEVCQAAAEPSKGKVAIAIYTPNVLFENPSARFAYVQDVARQVSAATGVEFQGKAFSRSVDLEVAIKKGEVQFAILDAVYVAAGGAGHPVLATATTRGEIAPHWALFSSGATDLRALRGQRLWVARTSARDDDFIENALFGGDLRIKEWFGGKGETPDLASAVISVKRREKDAALLPETAGQGLKRLLEAGRVPGPAFCQIDLRQPAELVAKLRQALAAQRSGAVLDGWKPADASAYRALGARMAPHVKRPVAIEPRRAAIDELGLLVPAPMAAPRLPDLRQ